MEFRIIIKHQPRDTKAPWRWFLSSDTVGAADMQSAIDLYLTLNDPERNRAHKCVIVQVTECRPESENWNGKTL